MSGASWNEDKSSAEGNQRVPATASDTPVRVAGGGESGRGRSAQYRAVLVVGILALWLVFALYVALCLLETEGHLTLASDDAYITMCVARNFAHDGTWGIEPGHFASLVSSPAWVLLMAGIFRLVGAAEWVPLAMNLFWATALIVLIWAILRSFRVHPLAALVGLFMALFLTPIIPVAFTGLEHMLQMSVDLAYLFAAGLVLGNDAPPAQKRPAALALLLLSPFVTLVRYEGMFLIAVGGGVLLARKQVRLGLLTAALGALPVVASGLIFLHKGWFFFPTTLLQKGNFRQSSTLWEYIVRLAGSVFAALHDASDSVRQATGAHLGVLLGLVLLACLYRSVPMFASRLGVMCALFFGTALLHLEFARLGSFYRYEAYLVCIGLVLFVLLGAGLEWKPPRLGKAMPGWISAASLAIALVLLMEPLWDRAVNAYDDTPLASRNIWEQQYQMGHFLHRYYEGASVALNDIGAVNYFARIHCCDLEGLANTTVKRLVEKRLYDTSTIRELARSQDARVALLYESWFYSFGGLPAEWSKAAIWTIPDNRVCGGPRVTFYAVDPAELSPLRSHLEEFTNELPGSVYVRIYR